MENKKKYDIKGRKALVVGLGKSGIAATQALIKLGAEVSVQDSKKIEEIDPQLINFLRSREVKFYFGKDPDETKRFDFLVLSPGVPSDLEFIKKAKKAGAEIIGELEIAYRTGRGRYAAITGTNGKTTTTSLVGEIFEKAGRKTSVVGNIGVAVISKAINADDDTWLVTEVSSFQLETVKDFKPEISAVLNLTSDHMDRHGSMKNYGAAKAKIFMNQDENSYVIINSDDRECMKLAEKAKARIVPFSRKKELDFGAFVKDGVLTIKDSDGKTAALCAEDELIIPGQHNVENALAAAAMAYFSGVAPAIISESLRTFKGVEHRIEFAGEVDGVRFVNDSKGTNPDAAIKAIEAVKGDIILIAGGYDKGSDFEDFVKAFGTKVKHVILIGKTAVKIKDTAERMGFTDTIIVKDMDACVQEGMRLAKPGDTVLLSPACASWDMYSNYEQRGKHFKNCVSRLEKR